MADAASKSQGSAPSRTGAPAAGSPSLPDLTGRTLGDYHILRRLGVGGMGQVYLARQLSLKREVALKLLRDELNQNPTALLRFQAEAEAVAKLNHPNIVHIHQMGEADGLRYMALEYVEGRNLRDHLARKGPPDLPVSLSIIRQVVNAIQQAHEHGIVHRDIKPENILVTKKVEVKVTDFGLSRFFAGETPALNLTQSGITLGTPLYMSPEQVQGHPVDHRSDIYSFGVTCYHLLSGEPPFRGATAFDVALKHVQEQPQALHDLCPDLPVDLCGMVHKMMAKDPNDRYASAREILRDLARVRDAMASVLGGAMSGAHLQIPGIAITTALPAAATQANSVRTTAGAPPQPRHLPRWALAAGICVLAATGGAIYSTTRTPSPAANAGSSAGGITEGSGDASSLKLPDLTTTTRERELIKLIETGDQTDDVNKPTPDDVIRATIELGLLYIHDRRLDEAAKRFGELLSKKFGKSQESRNAIIAGRLGQAVVLAYRNKKEDAEKSDDLVKHVVSDPTLSPKSKADKTPFQQVSAFLARHPDLAQAVSDSLTRNLVTRGIGIGRCDEPALELLRAPPRLGKP